MRRKRRLRSQWLHELDDLVRGACGGFLFGIPLIYTMEVWWIGASVSPALMLLTLVVTTVVVFLMNRTAGFRKTRSMTWTNAVLDTIEAMALGLLCAGFILILLRKVTFSTQLTGALGIIIFESVPFALGVTLANQFLQGDPNQDLSQEPPDNLNETLTDIGVTLIGAVIIAFSIAPTEEVPELAAAVSGGWLLAIIAVSLLLSYGVVFQASFANQPKRLQQRGLFQDPVSETLVSYIISLLASMLMLWFFHQVSFEDPWSLIFRYTVLLGLPATIGGAAGRLAI